MVRLWFRPRLGQGWWFCITFPFIIATTSRVTTLNLIVNSYLLLHTSKMIIYRNQFSYIKTSYSFIISIYFLFLIDPKYPQGYYVCFAPFFHIHINYKYIYIYIWIISIYIYIYIYIYIWNTNLVKVCVNWINIRNKVIEGETSGWSTCFWSVYIREFTKI